MSEGKQRKANWREKGLPIQKTDIWWIPQAKGQHGMKCTTLMFQCFLAATLSLRRQLMLLVPTKSHLFLNSISESVVPKAQLVFFVVVFWELFLWAVFWRKARSYCTGCRNTSSSSSTRLPNDNAFLSSLHKLRNKPQSHRECGVFSM